MVDPKYYMNGTTKDDGKETWGEDMNTLTNQGEVPTSSK